MTTDHRNPGKIANQLFHIGDELKASKLNFYNKHTAIACANASHQKSTVNNTDNLNQLAVELKGIISHVQQTLTQLSFQRDVDLTQFWALQLMCVKRVVDQLSKDISEEISEASTSYGVEPKKVAQAMISGLFAASQKDREVSAPMQELADRIGAEFSVPPVICGVA